MIPKAHVHTGTFWQLVHTAASVGHWLEQQSMQLPRPQASSLRGVRAGLGWGLHVRVRRWSEPLSPYKCIAPSACARHAMGTICSACCLVLVLALLPG